MIDKMRVILITCQDTKNPKNWRSMH